jgi:uncharacterized iron-regulated protein
MKKIGIYLGLVLLSFSLFTNCSDNDADESITDNTNLYKQVLANDATVIIATYTDLATKAAILRNAVYNLSIGDEAALQAAKDAWVAARAPWELSEAFLFGPVEQDSENGNIDDAIDSWPVDVTAINAIFASGIEITQGVIEANNDTRGFHTLEYYLWGINGDKTASQLTSREIEYLRAVALDLENKTAQLVNEWSPSGKNYYNVLVSANAAPYYSQEAALKELVEGMITIANEVGTEKIEESLNGNNGSAYPEKEESRFSKNSLLDFADNIRSIQNIYLGNYGTTVQGKGLTDIVAPLNPTLDALVRTKIIAAIQAIEAIPVSFTYAIYNNRPAVENAQAKVGELSEVLEKQLLPFMSNNL